MNILITGGAGFIGTHLTRGLLEHGHEVAVIDNFLPQVHGCNQSLAPDLMPYVRLVSGDVADPAILQAGLIGAECIVHLAAETGTGQSMYEVSRYQRTNVGGTALLYESLAKSNRHRVQRIVVASSRAIYGEGAYLCALDGIVYPLSRSVTDKQLGKFDPLCPQCGGACEIVPTSEAGPYQPSSFYGITKQMQEQTVLLFGNVLGISSFALRYQNVYGPGQSLRNPYTGILAIFSNLARSGKPINVFEDGKESRDFVYIEDVVHATEMCLAGDVSGNHAINIGSGQRTTVLEVAQRVNSFYGNRSTIEVTGAFRDGDIRHGVADLRRAEDLLKYRPAWAFHDGLRHFLQCAELSEVGDSGYEQSLGEMQARGLLHEKV